MKHWTDPILRLLRFLFLLIYLFASIFIPGSSLLFKKSKWAFSVPLLGFIWVGLISWSRLVVTPTGFVVMLTGLILLHILSYICGFYFRQKGTTPNAKHWLGLSLLLFLNASIAVSIHIYKDKWFGFAFYYIPSDSMYPTFKIGDVVMVDRWLYRNNTPQVNDVVIIQRKSKTMVLTKRVTDIRNRKEKTELYVEGDNSHRSVDSRRFGWVSDDHLIGKVTFIWFSFDEAGRLFSPVN